MRCKFYFPDNRLGSVTVEDMTPPNVGEIISMRPSINIRTRGGDIPEQFDFERAGYQWRVTSRSFLIEIVGRNAVNNSQTLWQTEPKATIEIVLEPLKENE